MPGTAGTVEILRAVQKDNIAVDKLQESLQDVVEKFLGQRAVLKYKREIITAAVAVYYTCTNLTGHQSLGEEYAGLVQTDPSFRKVPSQLRTACMIILLCWGDRIFEKVVTKLLNAYNRYKYLNLTLKERLEFATTEIEQSTHNRLHLLKRWLPWLFKVHTVLFYLHGHFFHISKRITGVHYVLVRRWFANQDENSSRNLKYLRWMSIINLILSTYYKYVTSTSTSESSVVVKDKATAGQVCENSHKCSLCLEKRNEPCVTPCGHLFCWKCILDWLQAKEECPICRTEVTQSRVVPLQNHF